MKFIDNLPIGKFIFNILREFECIRKYQGEGAEWGDDVMWATRQHINTSMIIAFFTSLTSLIHPFCLISYVVGFLLYSPLMELWFQYYKEKDKPLWDVMAQMLERGFAFGVFSPFLLIVLFVKLFVL